MRELVRDERGAFLRSQHREQRQAERQHAAPAQAEDCPGRVELAIDDDYRYRYIVTSRDPSKNGFGAETHYGQDFILKTGSGRLFAFAYAYEQATHHRKPPTTTPPLK